jgi:hypothetical protein
LPENAVQRSSPDFTASGWHESTPLFEHYHHVAAFTASGDDASSQSAQFAQQLAARRPASSHVPIYRRTPT